MPYNAHIEGRTDGAARGNLSALQLRSLIQLARSAFMHLVDQGVLGDSAEFDTWRHEQTMITTERAGFRECRNEDYLPLKQHFLRLLGRDQEADRAGQRSEEEARTWALHALHSACDECADVMPFALNYAIGMLRKKGLDEDTAPARSIYRALYTTKRRAEQLRKKQKGAA